jgi:hypothetical protein
VASNKITIEYLEQERVLLWKELLKIQDQLSETITSLSSIKDELDKYEKSIPDEVKSAKANAGTITKFKNQAASTKEEITKIFERVNSDYNSVELQASIVKDHAEKVTEIFRSATLLSGKITESYDHVIELDEHFENLDTIIEKIDSLEEQSKNITEIKDRTSQLLANAQKQHKEINDIHRKIFGYTYDDEETGTKQTVSGLRHELEKSYSEIKIKIDSTEDDIENLSNKCNLEIKNTIEQNDEKIKTKISQWQTEHDEILATIRSLLPGALTAGLSVAFSEKKNAELAEQNDLTKKFSGVIASLATISLIPVCVSLYFIPQGIEKAISLLPQLVSAVLPVYFPVLWLAYSYNKRLNLSKRLVEEYTHKEVLSKTFEGLSSQIDSIDSKQISSELRIKLLYNLLNVSSENPGKLISDYNKSDHPILDVMEKSSKLSDAVESLAKIPGMSAIGTLIAKKTEKILAVETKKVEDGLATVVNADTAAGINQKSEGNAT